MSKKVKKPKEKKKKLTFKKTLSNNLFALKIIGIASPLYLFIYLFSSVVYGSMEFLRGTYILRRIVNDVSSGAPIYNVLIFTAILGAVTIIIDLALNWYWNVPAQKMYRKISLLRIFKKCSSKKQLK